MTEQGPDSPSNSLLRKLFFSLNKLSNWQTLIVFILYWIDCIFPRKNIWFLCCSKNTGTFIPQRTCSLFHQHFVILSIANSFGWLPSGIVPLILWIRSPIVSAAVISTVWLVANGDNREKYLHDFSQNFIPVALFPDLDFLVYIPQHRWWHYQTLGSRRI